MSSVSRKGGAARFAAAAALVAIAGAAACGTDEALVGGSCAPGYTDCNNQCVLLSSDPNNCGACGTTCPSGMCVGGSCGDLRDARADAHDGGIKDAKTDGTHDGTVGDVGVRDGHTHDGLFSDTGTLDGKAPDAPQSDAPATDGTTNDSPSSGDAAHDTGADSCAPPYVTPAQCGSCGVACTPGNVCSPVTDAGVDAGGYICVPMCAAPYKPCDGTCLDVSGDDPDNCGACGHVCVSGICTNGVCEGATAGDIVIIGHDYAASTIRVSEATLLTNAVFLPPTNPLRVLSFEQYAVPSQVSHVKATLAANAPLGRSITYTVSNDYTTVGPELTTATFDVFLVYDQASAPTNTLGTVGSTLAMPMASFVAVGGDVVVLDGASGTIRQMTSFLSMGNLLQTSAETPVPATDRLYVVAPGDAVGNFVLSPYAPIADTIYFTTSEANGGNVTYIVDDGSTSGPPVVIHKTPPP